MGWEAFKPGDILIQAKSHCMLWVGAAKPLVHNVERGIFVGVIRQSTDPLTDTHVVYRYKDAELAAMAAKFAEEWAVTPSEELKLPTPTPKKVVLKTPYSHKRMEGAFDGTAPWSVDSLFRALKAIARAHDGTGLSPRHGASCSQFVTYCYQAAALKKSIGPVLPSGLIQAVRKDTAEYKPFDQLAWARTDLKDDKAQAEHYWRNKMHVVDAKVFKSKKGDRNFINTVLTPQIVHLAKTLLPTAFQIDAKTMHVEKLIEQLQHADWTRLGETKFNDKVKEYQVITG